MIWNILLLLGIICLLGCQGSDEVVIEGGTIRHNGKQIGLDQLLTLADTAETGEITLIIREEGQTTEQDLKEFVGEINVLSLLGAESAPPSWKGRLPKDATDVREFSRADGFLPDYAYMLRARVSESGFKAFVEKLGLTPHSEDREYSEETGWLNWSAAARFEEDWWNATDTLDGTYVKEGNDTWSYAKHEGGMLYFKSINH